MNHQQIFSIKEASQISGCTKYYIKKMFDSGKLKGNRLQSRGCSKPIPWRYQIPKKCLAQFLEEQCIPFSALAKRIMVIVSDSHLPEIGVIVEQLKDVEGVFVVNEPMPDVGKISVLVDADFDCSSLKGQIEEIDSVDNVSDTH